MIIQLSPPRFHEARNDVHGKRLRPKGLGSRAPLAEAVISGQFARLKKFVENGSEGLKAAETKQ
jgi:hypothetical protein